MLRRCKNYGRSCGSLGGHLLRSYAKDVRFGDEARGLLLQGVDLMADAVSTTLGPKGRNALIERLLISPRITKDGITVADNVELADKRANVGAQLVREAANNTNNEVGDGTTTATILARSIARQGFELVRESRVNPHQLRLGVLKASSAVCAELRRMSTPVERIGEVEAVARNALNGDAQLAGLIGDGIHELGDAGVFLVKEGNSLHDEVVVRDGLSLETGYLKPQFITQPQKQQVEYSDALLLITLVKLDRLAPLLPALELARSLGQPLIIIAADVCGEALNALLLNHLEQQLQVCALRAPGLGTQQREELQDLAIATGATLYDCSKRLQSIERQDFGKVGEAVIGAKWTHLLQLGGDEDALEARMDYIRQLIDTAGTDEEVDQLNERLGRLLASMAIVYVGGGSELEISEKKDRLNDALNAVRGAIQDGVVPGGGTAYLRCLPALEALGTENSDQQLGVRIVSEALQMPCATIARNAGVDPAIVVSKVLLGSGNFGYDAARAEYCNLVERGIVDPTNVLRAAMYDAAGIASLLATTEVLITEQPQPLKLAQNQVTNDLRSLLGT